MDTAGRELSRGMMIGRCLLLRIERGKRCVRARTGLGGVIRGGRELFLIRGAFRRVRRLGLGIVVVVDHGE